MRHAGCELSNRGHFTRLDQLLLRLFQFCDESLQKLLFYQGRSRGLQIFRHLIERDRQIADLVFTIHPNFAVVISPGDPPGGNDQFIDWPQAQAYGNGCDDQRRQDEHHGNRQHVLAHGADLGIDVARRDSDAGHPNDLLAAAGHGSVTEVVDVDFGALAITRFLIDHDAGAEVQDIHVRAGFCHMARRAIAAIGHRGQVAPVTDCRNTSLRARTQFAGTWTIALDQNVFLLVQNLGINDFPLRHDTINEIRERHRIADKGCVGGIVGQIVRRYAPTFHQFRTNGDVVIVHGDPHEGDHQDGQQDRDAGNDLLLHADAHVHERSEVSSCHVTIRLHS